MSNLTVGMCHVAQSVPLLDGLAVGRDLCLLVPVGSGQCHSPETARRNTGD